MRARSPPPLRNMTKIPYKTLGLIAFLFTAGLIFLSVGLAEYYRVSFMESLPYLLLGTLVIIPGIFYGFIFLAAWRRWPGYKYEMIPEID
jgi:hypothetical protein